MSYIITVCATVENLMLFQSL